MEISEILTSVLATYIVTSVIILTQVIKSYIPERFIPGIGFVLGALLTFIIFGFNTGVIVPSIIIGGASLGLYDLGKKTLLGK
jgi:hypothetical protein